MVFSNHNTFRVLFDKIASVYFIWKKIYLHFSTGNGQRSEPALCQLYRHTFVPHSGRLADALDSAAPEYHIIRIRILLWLPARSTSPVSRPAGLNGRTNRSSVSERYATRHRALCRGGHWNVRRNGQPRRPTTSRQNCLKTDNLWQQKDGFLRYAVAVLQLRHFVCLSVCQKSELYDFFRSKRLNVGLTIWLSPHSLLSTDPTLRFNVSRKFGRLPNEVSVPNSGLRNTSPRPVDRRKWCQLSSINDCRQSIKNERLPLCTTRLVWCSASRGSVGGSWHLQVIISTVAEYSWDEKEETFCSTVLKHKLRSFMSANFFGWLLLIYSFRFISVYQPRSAVSYFTSHDLGLKNRP